MAVDESTEIVEEVTVTATVQPAEETAEERAEREARERLSRIKGQVSIAVMVAALQKVEPWSPEYATRYVRWDDPEAKERSERNKVKAQVVFDKLLLSLPAAALAATSKVMEKNQLTAEADVSAVIGHMADMIRTCGAKAVNIASGDRYDTFIY